MAFPGSKLGLIVELALGADVTVDPSTWAWTDVTAAASGLPGGYIRASAGITITRGGRDGGLQAPPSTCTFTADNRTGAWVPTNPTGVWYGQIGKGTPVRIRTTESSSSVRWTGFLTSLPPRWNTKETDRYVTVTASGIFQRLERGKTPLRSPLVRTLSGTTPAPVAYWPGEDGSTSTSIAEFFGGKPITWTGTLTPASDGPDGSEDLPEFTTFVGVKGNVTPYANTNEWQVGCVFNMPSAPSGATTLLRWTTSGTYPVWQITLATGSPGTLTLEGYDSTGTIQFSGTLLFSTLGSGDNPYNVWLFLTAGAAQSGTDANLNLSLFDYLGGSTSTDTEPSITVGAVTSINVPATAKTNGLHVGHWTVWNETDAADAVDFSAISGYDGESVSGRAERLGSEEGIPVRILDTDPLTMGPQSGSTLLGLLRECEAVTNGRLFELMDPGGTGNDHYLRLFLHTLLENQDVALTLDHDSGHLAPSFEPVDDDTYLRNDVTATRIGGSGTGSSARVVADSGNLTPAKVGTYDDSVPVNVETDDQLPDQAGWRVNVGTVEGLRFPAVSLDFARNPSLIASWITLDVGSRVQITNPPAGIAPDTIDLLVEGWTEFLGPHAWRVNLNCSPYRPWHVFQLAETASDTDPFLGRLAEDEACALRDAATSGATSLLVDPNVTRWTTAADDFPLNIRVGGEVCTVSSIATTAATFVAIGSANHTDNGPRNATLPTFAADDLILVVGAIRSSGTGTVNAPTGYTRLPIFGAGDNVGVFAKVAAASESTPQVSFNDGVAGDTCSAVALTFRGTPTSLVDLADIVVDNIAQLNASAQNVAYGGLHPWKVAGCIQLFVAWKQDDYTSVAPPSGFTEAGEFSSTTGNDQSLYIAYKIDTTPSLTPEGSLAVTGGASAISRSAVTALAAGYQTFTVSARGVNGVTKAQTAGTKVGCDDPAVLAL